MEHKVAKSYCTSDDVVRAMGFSATDTNVTAAMITQHIKDASDEVDIITHTKYHVAEVSGTATGGSTTTVIDTSKTGETAWTINQWKHYVVKVNNEFGRIDSNTANTLTILTADTLTTAVVNTNTYEILPDVIVSETVDGTGEGTLLVSPYPIYELMYLKVVDTVVTPSKVYNYAKQGRLVLDSANSPEIASFQDYEPQAITIKYVLGIDHVPSLIKELTAHIAGLRCLVTQMGGSYNFAASYTIPHLSVSKGVPYMNITRTVDYLKKQVDMMIKRIPKYVVVV